MSGGGEAVSSRFHAFNPVIWCGGGGGGSAEKLSCVNI